MFGILLTALGNLFAEIGASIGKWEFREKKEPLVIMGFLQFFWMAVFFAGIIVLRGEFVFSLASLPTLIPRIFLDTAQAHVGLLAITKSERSTMGFITVGTIPLLLLVDMMLGYTLSISQIVGIAVIVISLMYLFLNHGFKKAGIWYVIFVTLNSVATLSLYKYNITHFNSVEVEQGIVMSAVLLYFTIAALLSKRNPFSYLVRYPFSIQSLSHGASGVIMSFAYVFAPASVITTAKRSFAVLATVISGNVYFKEKHLLMKVAAFFFVTIGLVLLAQK